jgi:hypothetical protein
MDEIFVKIDNETDNEIDFNKIDIIDKDKIDFTDKDKVDTDKPHNGLPIAEIEVSPNENYLVTYSQEGRSIVGWDITNGQLKPEFHVGDVDINVNVLNHQICVSDDKKLAYIKADTHKLGEQ